MGHQKPESKQNHVHLTKEMQEQVDKLRRGDESRLDCIKRLLKGTYELCYGIDAPERAKWNSLRVQYRADRGHWPEEEGLS